MASSFVSSLAMATSASFHGLQNGSRYQIDKNNYWRYNASSPHRKWVIFVSMCSLLVPTPHLLKTASIYWMRGQLLDLSLMMMASLRILFISLLMMCHVSN
ncbi:hypothetical protein BDR07DRAFT_1437169, partial [Suillus spraguei]